MKNTQNLIAEKNITSPEMFWSALEELNSIQTMNQHKEIVQELNQYFIDNDECFIDGE